MVSTEILPDDKEMLKKRMAEIADKWRGGADTHNRRNGFFPKRCDAGGNRGNLRETRSRDSGGNARVQHDDYKTCHVKQKRSG